MLFNSEQSHFSYEHNIDENLINDEPTKRLTAN